MRGSKPRVLPITPPGSNLYRPGASFNNIPQKKQRSISARRCQSTSAAAAAVMRRSVIAGAYSRAAAVMQWPLWGQWFSQCTAQCSVIELSGIALPITASDDFKLPAARPTLLLRFVALYTVTVCVCHTSITRLALVSTWSVSSVDDCHRFITHLVVTSFLCCR
jgi:hypothetical protein